MGEPPQVAKILGTSLFVAELVQFVPTQQFTGVFSCSEFEEPNRVRCTKDCVGEANCRS